MINLDYLKDFGMVNTGCCAIALASITLVEVDEEKKTAVITFGGNRIELNWEAYQRFEKSVRDLAYNIRLAQMSAGK